MFISLAQLISKTVHCALCTNINIMRIDKFLKVSRLLKRRSVAADACGEGLVSINGKPSKPAARLKVGDIIAITFGENTIKARVLILNEKASKAQAGLLYEIIE